MERYTIYLALDSSGMPSSFHNKVLVSRKYKALITGMKVSPESFSNDLL